MANPQNPNPPTYSPSKKKSGTFVPNPDEKQEQTQGQGPDHVEIGDPVPEKDRTTRASDPTRATRGGQGETGEDEDLPDDDGSIEGSRSDQH
jgi:hypothetical protein